MISTKDGGVRIAARPAKVVEAYACAQCGKTYGTTEQHKRMAEVCCTCPKCGGLSDRYTGTSDKLCASCKQESRWLFVTANLEQSLREYGSESRLQNRREPSLETLLAEHVERDRKRREEKPLELYPLPLPPARKRRRKEG